MKYQHEKELSPFYMFISACLTDEEREELKAEWEKQGGFKVIPWWKFVKNNTKIVLDIKNK